MSVSVGLAAEAPLSPARQRVVPAQGCSFVIPIALVRGLENERLILTLKFELKTFFATIQAKARTAGRISRHQLAELTAP